MRNRNRPIKITNACTDCLRVGTQKKSKFLRSYFFQLMTYLHLYRFQSWIDSKRAIRSSTIRTIWIIAGTLRERKIFKTSIVSFLISSTYTNIVAAAATFITADGFLNENPDQHTPVRLVHNIHSIDTALNFSKRKWGTNFDVALQSQFLDQNSLAGGPLRTGNFKFVHHLLIVIAFQYRFLNFCDIFCF